MSLMMMMMSLVMSLVVVVANRQIRSHAARGCCVFAT
jgi:hypothetical protein